MSISRCLAKLPAKSQAASTNLDFYYPINFASSARSVVGKEIPLDLGSNSCYYVVNEYVTERHMCPGPEHGN